MITGFLADFQINDGEASAYESLDGLVTLSLGGVEASTFDGTELNQGHDAEVMLPTGTKKHGATKVEAKYTKANYERIHALVGVRGKGFKVITPDDLTDDTPVKLTATITGFVSKLDDVKFEKGNPVSIPFEITPSVAPTLS